MALTITGAPGGATITDDTSTNATRYLLFDDVTTGASTTIGTSSTKLTFNPSTGTLGATKFSGDGSSLTGIASLSVAESTTTASPFNWNSDTHNTIVFTALANDLTINADSGSPTTGKKVIFRIKDNGTARALTWSSGTKGFRAIGVTLPSTTTVNKTIYIGAVYNNTDTFWDVTAVATQA